MLFGPVLAGARGTRTWRGRTPARARPTRPSRTCGSTSTSTSRTYVQYGLLAKRLVPRAERGGQGEVLPARRGLLPLRRAARQLVHAHGERRQGDQGGLPGHPLTGHRRGHHLAAVAIPVGVLSAVKLTQPLRPRHRCSSVLWGQALPVYYFGLLALYFLAYWPNSERMTTSSATASSCSRSAATRTSSITNPWPWFHHLILPAATLALQFTALYVRMLRSTMLTTMSEDYIRTARAKGVPERTVIYRHGLRNAILPIVTMFGLDLAILLGGSAILTETVFAIPGLGRLAVQGALSLDIALTRRRHARRRSADRGREHRRRPRRTRSSTRGSGSPDGPARGHATSARRSAPTTATSAPSTASRSASIAARCSASSASPAPASPSRASRSWASCRVSARGSAARCCSTEATCSRSSRTSCARSAATTSR